MATENLMTAAVLETYGAPLRIASIARPKPQAGQVLVRVVASGVNPLDAKIHAGKAPHARHPLPAILGMDLAGVVEEVAADVTRFRHGAEVYGMTGGVAGIPGSLAEYSAVDARLLAHKPANLGWREAAALPLAFITAWEGLVDRAAVHLGQKVLIQGGAGGVGHIAVQLARAYGADVFATASGAKKDLLVRLGATPIDYRETTVEQYVAEHTSGRGFDIVYDTVGGTTLDASFQAVSRYGHVVSCLGWGSHTLAPLSFRGATYSGVFTLLPMLTGEGRDRHGDILREAAVLAMAGKIKPNLDPRHFTLQTIEDAHQAVETGAATGKVVVDIDPRAIGAAA